MGFKAEMTLSLLDAEFIILKLLKLVRNYSFICLFPKYFMSTYYGSDSVLGIQNKVFVFVEDMHI